jgi:hypothetical protein
MLLMLHPLSWEIRVSLFAHTTSCISNMAKLHFQFVLPECLVGFRRQWTTSYLCK